MTHRLRAALTVAVFKLFAALPYGVTARLGDAIGKLLYQIPSRRRRIVLTNLALCFPDMDEARRQQLARRHFGHVMRSYLERGVQWFGDARRLDQLMVERGLAPSLEKATALILAGQVTVDERRIDKPGTRLPAESAIKLAAGKEFVGRGALKLDAALRDFGIQAAGLICCDVGSSTGGFTRQSSSSPKNANGSTLSRDSKSSSRQNPRSVSAARGNGFSIHSSYPVRS